MTPHLKEQATGASKPRFLDELDKVLADLKVATQDVGEASQRQNELSDELRALPPDKAVEMAVQYLSPPETEARKRTAFLLLRNAANSGDGIGMLSLSYLYSSGVGTPASRADAKVWLRKSAEAGHPDGMYEFSIAVRQGEYDGLGESDGQEWLKRSAAKGHQPAVDELKGIQVRSVVSALGALGSILGSRNNDESPTRRGLPRNADRGLDCRCGGYESSYGRAIGGREMDYDACRQCEHDKSDHRR